MLLASTLYALPSLSSPGGGLLLCSAPILEWGNNICLYLLSSLGIQSFASILLPTMIKIQTILALSILVPTSLPAEQDPSHLVRLLRQEKEAGMKDRGIEKKFEMYQAYSDGRLDESEGSKTWSDKTGNCRLKWYDGLMRNQLDSPLIAEAFTRELHETLSRESGSIEQAISLAAVKLDLAAVPAGISAGSDKATDALGSVRDRVTKAETAFKAFLKPLTREQRDFLYLNLYEVTTRQIEGHSARFPDAEKGRRLCDLMEATDRQALLEAGGHVAKLSDPALLEALSSLSDTGQVEDGVLIGGPQSDTYDLDALSGVSIVIDLGGNDTYLEGTLSAERPVLVILDLAGDDTYRGEKPGIQGGAVLGVSMVVDFAGDDVYDAQDVAQGACVAGIGLLVDFAGNDSYRGLRRNQGSALGGVGILLDRAGTDSYHSALYAQGFGGPLGFGVLDDLDGADHYYAGGKWLDNYEDTRGYDGWSQGVGAGPRGIANGGIGVLLDGGGDDVYEFDYFSHGGGYWFAAGFARDFGGNDRRLGATRLAYDGGERDEPIFLRWGIAWQAHYGLGFVIDDRGNDAYGGDIVGLGFSWDFGVAGLLDFGGDDVYQLTYGAQGQQAGYGMLYDVGGDDQYAGADFGGAPANVTYHPLPDCGGNFAFSVNYGGTDRYGEEDLNNQVLERGSPGGFLIDRKEIPALK